MVQLEIQSRFLYGRDAGWGHIRIETEKNVECEFSEYVFFSHFQAACRSGLELVLRKKQFLGFDIGADRIFGSIVELDQEIELLLLYEIFDLYGLQAKLLKFGVNRNLVFLSHSALPQAAFLREITDNFAREKCIRKMEGSL